jgi:hypothetical protein
MLKSIVNGAEHDIVSIPMKGKNLFPQDSLTGKTTTVRDTFNEIASSIVFNNGQYTISMDITAETPTGIFKLCFTYTDDSQEKSRWITKNTPTITLVSNGEKVVKSISITDYNYFTDIVLYDIMLNAGSQALPYEPYGYQNGWEVRDNQNRLIWGREDELQTTTGNLLFKGYDLPIKVNSLLGSATQNGTPSPDNVVVPEFCGVRTKNICPSARAETKTNNGITAVSNGSGTYHVSGTATADADIRFNVQSFWIPQSIGNYHDGTFSMFNSAIYDNTAVKLAFYYQGTKLDDWGLTTLNRTNTTYSNMSEKDCDAIGFTVKSGVTVDFTISPEFTNDGILPTEFEPYGYKISFNNNGENLFDKSAITSGAYANLSGTATNNSYYCSDFIPITAATYYFQNVVGGSYQNTVVVYDANKQGLRYAKLSGSDKVSGSITFQSGDAYIRVNCYFQTDVDTVMVNIGSTPLPYSPYLNKTTPIYLSEVPTIRRIKCVDLGTLTYTKTGSGNFSAALGDGKVVDNSQIAPAICSHFKVVSANNYSSTPYSLCASINLQSFVSINKAGYEEMTVAEFKSAMSGVLLWYALANPETGIVNEPLSKIGNYADELTEISVHNLSAPLYGIGDYKDILNLSTGVLTRNIRKLVLTGNENWALWSSDQPDVERYYYKWGKSTPSDYGLISTHLPVFKGNGNFEHIRLGGSSRDDFVIFISKTIASTVADFKSYLAAQYQAGTPVTAWYVISTPETETVTVPTGMTGEIEGYLKQISTPTPTHPSIPKWNGEEETGGTYAVTVYDLPEIPTTTGKNTLTVETEKIHGLTNPLCGIGDYKDVLNLSTGIITRKIKKLVLDGTENWIYRSGEPQNVYFLEFAGLVIVSNSGLCTHYPNQDSGGFSELADKRVLNRLSTDRSRSYVAIRDSSFSLLSDFQSYLAAQYANGTPVTVWYVVETPETETITVPYGLECSVEGYLTQSGTPTPLNPITPESNGILESNGTYAVEVSLVPSNLTVKGHIKPIQ